MWVTSVAEVYNPDEFPRVRARGCSSVDQLVAPVDRSRGKPRLIDRSASRAVRTDGEGLAVPFFRTFLAPDFQQRRPKPPAVISPATRLSPLHLPQGFRFCRSHVSPVIHGRLFPERRCTSPRTLFKFFYPRLALPFPRSSSPVFSSRSCVTSTAMAGTISSLNATSPRYMFILSSVTMEYVTRAMQPCGSIICIRLF